MNDSINTISCNIDEEILQLLTQNPNKWMSVISLYNQYTKEHTVNKKEFIVNCELLNTRFNNVRKYHKNNLCYLAFVTNNSLIPEDVLFEVEEKYNNYINDEIFRSLDRCDVIEYMIKNSNCCENLSLSEYFDGVDTALHILFKKGRIDLVNTLVSCYDIDFDIKNGNNESLLDVLNYSDKNASKLVKLVFEHQFAKLNETNNNNLNKIKQTNTQLLETNKKLSNENSLLKKQIMLTNVYKYVGLTCFIVSIITFLLK